MDEIINKWVNDSIIDISSIPLIAETYLKEVVHTEMFDSEIQLLMSSGAFKIIDWTKALWYIASKLNYQIMELRNANGAVIYRYINNSNSSNE